jgi:Tol biopolymer transport system component/DNA-binding winged helix-turn-helix (wHTH) protein
MAVMAEQKQIIHFGVFEVDLKSGELRRNGSKLRLQEQPFQILSVLLEKPGEVVTREELRARLWPADTFVDFDHSLNTAVRRLRDALGDSAENPRFVETVARRGYRFLVPLSASRSQPLASPRRKKTPWVIGIASALLLVVGSSIGWHASRRALPPPVLQRRLTANPEEDPVTSAVLSPDGKYLAFSDRRGFYLEQVDTGETHTVPLPKVQQLMPARPELELLQSPMSQPSVQTFSPDPASWFPDSTHLVATWAASPEERRGVWEISLLGGAPRKLAADAWRPSVSRDGTQIAFISGTEKSEGEVWVMNANGEQPRKLRSTDGTYCGTPQWSPDGRYLVFARATYMPGAWESIREIDVLEVATAKSRILFSRSGLGPAVAWTADGRLIFSLDEPPPNQNDSNLWWVRLDERTLQPRGEPTRITTQSGGVAEVSLSADGKQIAVTRREIQPDVYIGSLQDHGTKLGPLQRLTLDERADVPYSWTPDSKSVIFVSDRFGAFNIFRQGINELTPDLLVGGQDKLSIARLSPDGAEVIYVVQPKLGDATTMVRLMRVPRTGGPSKEILEAPAIMNQQCARSPSTVCLYSQMINRDEMRLFFFDPQKGKGTELESARVADRSEYAFNWSLSPDGRLLAMTKKSGVQGEPAIRLLSIADGSDRFLPIHGWPGIACLDWAADGKSIWAIAYATSGKTLLNVDLHGNVRPMLQDDKMELGWAIPSPDGRQLALWRASGSSNVWLVRNF